MRLIVSKLLTMLLLTSLPVFLGAQLRVDVTPTPLSVFTASSGGAGAAGARYVLGSEVNSWLLPVATGLCLPLSFSSPLNRPALESPRPAVFDFTRTAPHLAFFCRLEINEAKGNIIPAKFRLGGHRYWQDDLGRRD